MQDALNMSGEAAIQLRRQRPRTTKHRFNLDYFLNYQAGPRGRAAAAGSLLVDLAEIDVGRPGPPEPNPPPE